MKNLIFATLLLFPNIVNANLNDTNFLKAISEIETGNNNKRVGKSGERSKFQFMPSTWRRYTKAPFINASKNEILATTIAYKHLAHIKDTLVRNGYEVNAFNCAIVWNGGFGALSKPRNRVIDYAQRTENIYGELNSNINYVRN